MEGSFFETAGNRLRTGLADVSRKWGWYLALGFFLMFLGTLAFGSAVATTLFTVIMLGWILLISGAGMAVLSFLTGSWSGFLLTLAAGALSVIAGISILSNPVAGAVGVTLMVGTILIAAGIFRLFASLMMRFPSWGWSAISGLTSIIVGGLLLRTWQTASLYFLGLYIGIDLFIHGISWMMFAFGVHNLARTLDITEEERRAA